MPDTRQGLRKWDESDFEFVVEEIPESDGRKFYVAAGRILDRPNRHRSVKIGTGHTKSIVVCVHSKLVTQPCALCEYESEVLTRNADE